MKCLVTGGMGFIGSHIVDELVSLGHTVTVIDDMSAEENNIFWRSHNGKKTEYIIKDISKDNCSDCFAGVDYVFHLAARSRIQPTIKSPGSCFEVNVVGTQRVLEWSRMHSVKKVIYSGTSSLYGHQNPIPFHPNMPVDCLNPYSMSKWMGEQVCRLYSQNYQLPCTVLRYFNVYGPREPTKGQYAPVIGLFKRQAAAGRALTIVGDGCQRRDFTYVSDVVAANIKAMSVKITDDKFKIYNVGTGKNYSINEIATLINGTDTHMRVYVDERPAEVRETLADIQKTVSELGWVPVHALEDKIMSY